MTTAMMTALGIALIAFVAPLVRPDPRKRALARARHTGELGELVSWVGGKSAAGQADAWNRVCSELWQQYERELVARVLREALPRCDAKILQYWLSQVLTLEPEIAATVFDPAFLSVHYKPEVASQCGRCGCKG